MDNCSICPALSQSSNKHVSESYMATSIKQEILNNVHAYIGRTQKKPLPLQVLSDLQNRYGHTSSTKCNNQEQHGIRIRQ